MQRAELLDPDNEHIYCLHLVFLHVIQNSLDEFRGAWNQHGLRTERGSPSPTRLLIRGLSVFHRVARKYGTTLQRYDLQQVSFPRHIIYVHVLIKDLDLQDVNLNQDLIQEAAGDRDAVVVPDMVVVPRSVLVFLSG